MSAVVRLPYEMCTILLRAVKLVRSVTDVHTEHTTSNNSMQEVWRNSTNCNQMIDSSGGRNSSWSRSELEALRGASATMVSNNLLSPSDVNCYSNSEQLHVHRSHGVSANTYVECIECVRIDFMDINQQPSRVAEKYAMIADTNTFPSHTMYDFSENQCLSTSHGERNHIQCQYLRHINSIYFPNVALRVYVENPFVHSIWTKPEFYWNIRRKRCVMKSIGLLNSKFACKICKYILLLCTS